MILIIILLALLLVAVIIGLQGLIYWGIGYFVCWAFSIPFVFTYWHGLAIAFIVSTLSSIFNRDSIKVKLSDLDID